MPTYRIPMDLEAAYKLYKVTSRIRAHLAEATGSEVRTISPASLEGPAFEVDATSEKIVAFKQVERGIIVEGSL